MHGRNGWYLEDLVRLPGAVTGATELLIVEALERLAADGSRFATLGIAPLRGSDRQMDRRARWLSGALRLAFERFDARYHFASLSRFKAKFRPSGWEGRYAAFLPRRPSVGLVRAVVTVLDPDPAADERPSTPAAAGRRVLVALQAVAVGIASVAVLAGERVGSPVGPAPLVAPVGIAGIGLAAVLAVIAARLGREPRFGVRLATILLEACIVVATLGRLWDRRAVLLDLVSIAVALSVVVLMVRRSPDDDMAGRCSRTGGWRCGRVAGGGRWARSWRVPGDAVVCVAGAVLSTSSTGSGHVQVVRPSLSFGIRSVLAQSTGRTGSLARTPFTLGVIAPDDPYRDDPGFSEAPVDAGGRARHVLRLGPQRVLRPGDRDEVGAGSGGRHRGRGAIRAGGALVAGVVDLQLDGRGTAALRSFTRSTMGSQDAFVVDDRVVAAPTVHGVVTNGALQVSGLPASEVEASGGCAERARLRVARGDLLLVRGRAVAHGRILNRKGYGAIEISRRA